MILKMHKQKLRLGCIATAFALTACVNIPYRAPTQQGNVIEANRVSLIQKGMTRAQIAANVGTPIMQDVFHKDRWDYIYSLDEHYNPLKLERITVWFTNDIVTRIEQSKVSQ